MTRKHFKAIARILAMRNGHDYSTIDFDAGFNRAVWSIAQDLADYFEEENSNFDRSQFLTACGFQGTLSA
jgi:mevalonate pyrophosphate decarboxylase